MVEMTEINGTKRHINPDLIELIDTVPDTLVVLVNGHRYMVREHPDTIIERIVEFRRRCSVPPTIDGGAG